METCHVTYGSAKSVKRFLRYSNLFLFFKLAAVRHLRFVGHILERLTRLFVPIFGVFWGKACKKETFLHFNHSGNAITHDCHHIKQTE